ncbi:tia invasion determinant [uncultured Brachyspira sp.]|uniref:tia invasion determinant n=1 Tax=uncultured Brachyspira sp. TaxID=221953 RepID=UPI00260B6E98|nr:tia invasion determinant [uncultured Brachyspira sp.]
MKRFVIILLFFIAAFTNKNLFSATFSGLYIAPKLNFKHEALKTTNEKASLEKGCVVYEKNNYIGGGLAVGYDLFRKTRLIPLRIDLEYTFQGFVSGKDKGYFMQNIMGSIYYDINVFFLKNSELDTVTSKVLYQRTPLMNLYIGLSIGNRLFQTKYNYENTDIGETIITRSSFVFGINAGIVYNILDWFAIDLGYRYIIGFGFNNAHEVLLGARFTIR